MCDFIGKPIAIAVHCLKIIQIPYFQNMNTKQKVQITYLELHKGAIWYVLGIMKLRKKISFMVISPYNITPESHIKIMRIKEMITTQGSSWLMNKFSLSEPQEMSRE